MRRSRWLGIAERFLLATSLACGLVWGSARIHALATQARALQAFTEACPEPTLAPAANSRAAACPSESPREEALPAHAGDGWPSVALGVPKPDMSTWDPARRTLHARAMAGLDPGRALGRLDIPSLKLAVVVLPGIGPVSLNGGVGHIPGTPMPGEGGNVGIAGHRDGFFRPLERVREGDMFKLTTPRGVYEYRVEWTKVVEPKAVEVLADPGHDAITLVTCYPFRIIGSAPLRFIVRARCVAAPA